MRLDLCGLNHVWLITSCLDTPLSHHTWTTHELLAKAMMSLSSQKKAESDLLIISNLLSSFMAYTLLVALCLTWKTIMRQQSNQTYSSVCYIYSYCAIQRNKKTEWHSYQLHLSKCTPPNNFNHLIVLRFHSQITNVTNRLFVWGGKKKKTCKVTRRNAQSSCYGVDLWEKVYLHHWGITASLFMQSQGYFHRTSTLLASKAEQVDSVLQLHSWVTPFRESLLLTESWPFPDVIILAPLGESVSTVQPNLVKAVLVG